MDSANTKEVEGNSKKNRSLGRTVPAPVRLAILVLLVSLLAAGAWLIDRNANKSQPLQKNIPIVTYGSSGAASGSYEVVNTQKTADTLRISVVTGKRDNAGLIAINDSLLGEYENRSESLFIDYFDDKEVARIYFEKINDPKISTEQKKELVRHYIAVMVKTPAQGKKMFRVESAGTAIKTY